jgi:Flp pilus assembly pilin Flp
MRAIETPSDSHGQGVVEYGLILALSALLAASVLLFLGPTMSAVLDAIGKLIEQAS